MGTAILISDSYIVVNTEKISFLDISENTFIETLKSLQSVECDLIIIYAEMKFLNGLRIDHMGVELVKHIRLTPELANINRKPILLLHWLDVAIYIEQNRENIFLFSPGIYLKRLPSLHIKDIEVEPFDIETQLSEYLFNSENDERLSAHHFRNQLAIEEFKTQSENGNISILEKPLWFKKLYYKSGYFNRKYSSSNHPITQSLRILLIDDLAEQWKETLLMVLPNANIEYQISLEVALVRINSLCLQKSNNRLEYNKLVERFKSVIQNIEVLDNELTELISRKKSIEQNINASLKKIEESKSKIGLKTIEFNEFINILMNDGSLLELMMSEQILIDRLNYNSGKEVDKLQEIVRFLLKEKNSIETEKSNNQISSTKLDWLEAKIPSVQSEYDSLKQQQVLLIREIKTRYEGLIRNEFDMILLDMHLSMDSEGKEISDMDGYKILVELKQKGLNIPVVLFTATNKRTDELYEKFTFLNKHRYLKGITPTQEFFIIIERIIREFELISIIGAIDEIIAFPVYLSRIYHDYNSPDYDLLFMNKANKGEVKKRFEDIKKHLIIFKSSNENTYLTSVLRELSNIQSNFRFSVSNPQNGVSLFSHTNLIHNHIDGKCVLLNSLRNKDIHNEKITLNLNDINGHLTTVYEGLIFDK